MKRMRHIAYLPHELASGNEQGLMDETVKAAVEGACALVTLEQGDQLRAGTHWLSVEIGVEKRPDGKYRLRAWPVLKPVMPDVDD